MYWYIIVIVLCLLLLLFLLWKEFKRPNKSWLAVRIIASVLCIISLACIALPLTIKQTRNTGGYKEVVLLTEGFNADSVQKLLSANEEVKVYAFNNKIKAFNAHYSPDIIFFAEPFQHVQAVHVFGYGLDDNDLRQLANLPVIFHPAIIENQITSIDWPQILTSGESLLVQGKYNNTTSARATIVLSAFNTNLDSVTVAANQTSYFQLTTIPKHLDKAVYSIIVLSGKDTLEHEPIPVEVNTAEPFSILLIAATPDFENKFLKNWLSKNEYKLAVRTIISKNKYNKEYINLPIVSLDRITPSLLEKFDVVIADASALSQLSSSEIATMKGSIESTGLGLIVKTDSVINTSAFYTKLFPLIEVKDSIQHTIKLNLSDTSNITAPLKVDQPIYIRSVAGTQSLVTDQQRRTVVNSKIYGTGKVVLTTIANTYTWQLAGKNNDYTNYWSAILNKAAKQSTLQEVWNISPLFPYKDEEVHLQLQTINGNIPKAQVGKDMVYMQQSYYLPYQWNATYWPEKTGWQPIINQEGKSNWWYIYDTSDWKPIKAIIKIKATKKYEENHTYSPKASITSVAITIEIPKIYFFIVFALCSGFLWFENKFNNR